VVPAGFLFPTMEQRKDGGLMPVADANALGRLLTRCNLFHSIVRRGAVAGRIKRLSSCKACAGGGKGVYGAGVDFLRGVA